MTVRYMIDATNYQKVDQFGRMNGSWRTSELWSVDGREKHTSRVFQVKLAKLMRAVFLKRELMV